MEPLPTQGQTLKHYNASRPRPRRTHKQPPSSRPQDLISEEKNEASEAMGRVDEGVEEFFTKKIISDYALKGQWEESNPAQATPSESSLTPSSTTPFSSSSDIISPSPTTVTSPCSVSDMSPHPPDLPPLYTSSPHSDSTCVNTPTITISTKNIKKKFGDFFAFKRARAGRAAKAGGDEGGVEGVKLKKTSIADLIRPLREGKEKERKRERVGGSEQDENICNDATIKEGTVSTKSHLSSDMREAIAPTEPLTKTKQLSETSPSGPPTTTSPELAPSVPPKVEDAAGHRPSPEVIFPLTEQETQSGGTPYGEKRLRVARRLREGKSQSLILLTALEPEDKDNTPSKKHASESTAAFEQKLQVMLQRMGVAKTPPADTKMCQNKDEEMRKANSEGAILDKPEPPPTHSKPRTMSTSSADHRHPIRPKSPLHPKPALPDFTRGLLAPKPTVAAKPPLPTPAARPSSAPASSSSADPVQLTASAHNGRQAGSTVQNGRQEAAAGATSSLSPRKQVLPSASAPWRGVSPQDRSEKAQSVTEESLPKPRQHLKPLPQRRAVSVHEDALAMAHELRAVLQRSPVRFQGTRWDLPSCSEDKAQRTDAGQIGKQLNEGKEETDHTEELKAKRGRKSVGGTVAETESPLPETEDEPQSACSSSKSKTQEKVTTPRTISSQVTLERHLEVTQTPGESPVSPKSPSTAPHTPANLRVSPQPQENISRTSPETPQGSPLSHKHSSVRADQNHSTQEREEVLHQQDTKSTQL